MVKISCPLPKLESHTSPTGDAMRLIPRGRDLVTGNTSGAPASSRALRCARKGTGSFMARGDLTTLRVAQASCSPSIIWPRGPDTLSKVQYGSDMKSDLRPSGQAGCGRSIFFVTFCVMTTFGFIPEHVFINTLDKWSDTFFVAIKPGVSHKPPDLQRCCVS